jgi:hypothetical protein
MAENDRTDLKRAPASPQTAKSATGSGSQPSDAFGVGQLILHRYKILGRAPFDKTTFRAKDLRSDRIVAVRPLVADVVSGVHKLDLLTREVARLRGLQHSNLIQLFELESSHKPPFVVSELAKGFSLQELLQARRGLAWEEAVQILRPVANVLDFASAEKVLDARISPRRVFIEVSKTSEEPAELLQMLVFTWPPFNVKVDPLTFVRLDSLPEGKGVPAGASPVSNVQAFAVLTYELLGGAKVLTSNGQPNPAPLPALNASANATLSAGITNPASFQTSSEFLAAMEKAAAKRNDRGVALGKKPDISRAAGKQSVEPKSEPKAPISPGWGPVSRSLVKIGAIGLFVAIAAVAGVIADVLLRRAPVAPPAPKQEALFVPKQPVKAIVGQISINSTPAGATFEISDANEQVTRGITPMTVDNLLVGQYRVRLQHPGWPDYLDTVSIQPGKTATLDHTFPTFDVNLRSDPPGATILIDQFELGETPLTIPLPPEPVELVSRMGDLEPVRKRVVPDSNHAATVEFKHDYGTLMVSSNRPDAEITIEGASGGNPPVERPLSPGRHSVMVRAPGFPDQTEVADVQKGQRIMMAFNFATSTPPSGTIASNSSAPANNSQQSKSAAPSESPGQIDTPASNESVAPSESPAASESSAPSALPAPASAPTPANEPPASASSQSSSSPRASDLSAPSSSPAPAGSPSPGNPPQPANVPATTSSPATSKPSRPTNPPPGTNSAPAAPKSPKPAKHSRPKPKPEPSAPAFPLGFRTQEEYERARDDAFRQFNADWDTQKRELEKSKAYSEYWAARTTSAERDQWVADNQRTQQSLSQFESQRNAAREALKKKWLGQE